MDWMASHGSKRTHPEDLVPGTSTVITARMDYLPAGEDPEAILASSEKAYISRYALGRDYHKLMRGRLAKLAKRIEVELGGGQYRAFVDSAPVLERALAENAGLGWIGKNTMLINDKAGSWFFLGEIYTDVPLPADPPQQTEHCGSCQACIDICPTNAFIDPWVLDARKCISTTIEFDGVIPESLRPAMGNQSMAVTIASWYAPGKVCASYQRARFAPRHDLDAIDLVFYGMSQLFVATASAIRRIGFQRWRRNVAIALGNAETSDAVAGVASSL